ncbi:MAG: hypothetical protein J6Y52_06415 [Bacteroidales bacterium]|nr:hypothetical protein [Bacteroidales bacterium]
MRNTGGVTHYTLLALLAFLTFHLLPFTSNAQVGDLPLRRVPSNIQTNRTGTNNQGRYNNNTAMFPGDTADMDSLAVQGIEYHKEIPDSVLQRKVHLFRYRPTHVWIDELWYPTLDPTGVQYNDPLDALNGNYYLSKGTLGQHHIGIFPTLADGLKMQLQPNGYEGFYMTKDNLSLYQTLTPFTMLSYNGSLNKDYHLQAAHTQNIMPGWNLAFNYRLFSPEGVYTSSGTINNHLTATTNYFSPDSRLQAVAGVIWHKFRIEENGGLVNDSVFTENIQTNRAGIPVNLTGATGQQDLLLFGRVTFSLERQSDAYRHRDSLVVHKVNDSVTITDTIDIIDTIPLRSPHLLNLGVLGLELNNDSRKRAFIDSTHWLERSATLFWTNDAYPDHRWRNPLKVTLGIMPRSITADIEGDTLRLISLFNPFLRTELALLRGSLILEGQMLGNFYHENDPDHRFAATLYYPLDSARISHIAISAVAQRQCPDARMIHDALAFQNTALQPINTERYRLRFVFRDIIDLDFRSSHMNHNTWYEMDKSIVEGTNSLWLTQLSATLRLAAGPMHLDVQQHLQHSTDSVQMPVPLWASKNSFYADFHLFHRTLRVQAGIDVRYHTPFFASSYDPYTGLFLHQRTTLVGGYLWGDVFINLQVKRASIYVKAGHLNALWEDKPQYFLLPHYPGQSFGLYWGITWRFFD